MKPIIVFMPKWTPFRPLERCFNKAIFNWTFLKLSHPKSFCSAFVGQGTDNRSRELLSKLHCFEPLSGTASKHFVCQDIGLSYIFKLIVSTSEEIICYIKVVVLGQVKQENSKVSDCRPWLKNFACLSSLIPRKEFSLPSVRLTKQFQNKKRKSYELQTFYPLRKWYVRHLMKVVLFCGTCVFVMHCTYLKSYYKYCYDNCCCCCC